MAATMKGKRFQSKMGNKPHSEKQTERPKTGRLDEDTMGYYRRVSDTLAEEFESVDDKELFIQNVFAQTEKEEIKLSQNQTVSRILENLIQNGKKREVRKFMAGLGTDFHKVCFDRFAAYVLQTIIIQIPKFETQGSGEQEEEEEGENVPLFETLLLQLCELFMDQLSDVLHDTYASHVMRTVFEVLGGVKVTETVVRSRLSRQQQNKDSAKQHEESLTKTKPRKKFRKMLKKFTKLILQREDIQDLLCHVTCNPVIQTLLLVLHQVNKEECKQLCHVVMAAAKESSDPEDETTDEKRLPIIFTHDVGSHLGEVLLLVADEEILTKLYKKHIAGNVLHLACHPRTNFVLQKFLTIVSSVSQFEEIFDECVVGIEDILAHNHIGVIIRLAETCIKHNTRQSELLQALMQAFHCYKPKSRQKCCVKLFASFAAYEVFYEINKEEQNDGNGYNEKNEDKQKNNDNDIAKVKLSEINLQGSLLLQQLLNFSDCSKVVKSLLELSEDELYTMSCDQSGSHVIEAFFKSNTAGEKKKEQLIEKLRGWYVRIACTKHGSRTVDSIWNHATLKVKFTIAEELAKRDAQLSQDRFGRFVHRNCAIGHFKHRRNDWKDIQKRDEKKRKMFSDILGNESEKTSAKKARSDTDPKPKTDVKYQQEMKALGFDDPVDGASDEDQQGEQEENEIEALFKRKLQSKGASVSNVPKGQAKKQKNSHQNQKSGKRKHAGPSGSSKVSEKKHKKKHAAGT